MRPRKTGLDFLQPLPPGLSAEHETSSVACLFVALFLIGMKTIGPRAILMSPRYLSLGPLSI